MLKSMTAYGRATARHPLGQFEVEVQAVNRRFLEVACFLPRELTHHEVELRKIIAAEVARGHITVRVNASYDQGAPLTVKPNLALARQLKEAWEAIIQEIGTGSLSDSEWPQLLAREEGIVTYGSNRVDDELSRKALVQALQQALERLNEMRQLEGNALSEDVKKRAAILETMIGKVGQQAKGLTSRYREKLLTRLNQLVEGGVDNEERVLREIVVYADKVDVTEEITRAQSHLQQVKDVLQGEGIDRGRSPGKVLEFLVQELNREVNTIGAKAGDAEIAALAVICKGELERIREQVQNVE